MAPKAPSLSQLFHPKKKTQQKQYSGVNGAPKNLPKPGSPQKTQPPRTSTPTPSVKADDDDDTFKLPTTPYSEFRILSSAMQGWKYDVMKFDSRKTVDLNQWQRPIKLNRKDLRKDDPASVTAAQPQAVGPMLGPDGKPVIGVDGRVVMVDAEGKPIHSGENGYGGASGSSSRDKGKGNAGPGRKRFQKKTRQVFLVPDEVRQLRKEERYPWVMEDSSPNKGELWVGHLEEVSKAETHALFMPAVNDSFKFIPPHRWYKFQKKIKHDLPTDTANVESLYTQSQKKDPHVFLASLNGGRGASSATAALFKQEAEGKQPASEGQSLGPGGRKLKTVDSGANDLFGDDDEDGSGSRRRKDLDQDGDMDEQVYEEEFADDEENMNVDENDEEAKEIEERLKREYQRANKQNEVGIDEDEEDDDTPKSRQAKALEKMMRDREGNNAYESDDEKNPYASSDEEEEEEPEPVHTGPAIQQQPQQVDPNKPSTPKPPASTPQTTTNSRANSPAASPSLGGHSLVAKRATSPKVPKSKMPGSRGTSPSGSRANSPTPTSRATSPLATSPTSSGEFKNNKRKADDSPTSPINGAGANDIPKPKKKKLQNTTAGNVSVSASELEALLIEWLKITPNATTRNCVQHFNSYMLGPDGPERRKEFSSLVKRVAILKEGVLTLKPGVG